MKEKIIMQIDVAEWDKTGCPCDPRCLKDVEILNIVENENGDFIFEVDVKEQEQAKKEDVVAQNSTFDGWDTFGDECAQKNNIEILKSTHNRQSLLCYSCGNETDNKISLCSNCRIDIWPE